MADGIAHNVFQSHRQAPDDPRVRFQVNVFDVQFHRLAQHPPEPPDADMEPWQHATERDHRVVPQTFVRGNANSGQLPSLSQQTPQFPSPSVQFTENVFADGQTRQPEPRQQVFELVDEPANVVEAAEQRTAFQGVQGLLQALRVKLISRIIDPGASVPIHRAKKFLSLFQEIDQQFPIDSRPGLSVDRNSRHPTLSAEKPATFDRNTAAEFREPSRPKRDLVWAPGTFTTLPFVRAWVRLAP
ncbi:MAG: hypothetical protein OXU72_05600 [Gammaproteobacteria bacterium]|nr:hypothetical protein [Gammaproteobacteria bacterium]